MGLGTSRLPAHDPIQNNDVPENPPLPENVNRQLRHLNPEIDVRTNRTGKDFLDDS